MQLEFESRDDAEISAAAAQRPEELRILPRARAHEPAVRQNHVRADDVVAREAVAAHQPSEAAAERETGDAGGRHRAAGRREAVRGRRVVEVAPRRSAAGQRDLAHRIDDDIAHAAQVDHQTAIHAREAGRVVTAAAHGEREIVGARELHRTLDVTRALAERDARGTTVDHAVPHGAPRVVVRGAGKDHFAVELVREVVERTGRNN